MKNFLFTLLLLLISQFTFAQTSADYATITGTITDYASKKLIGQVILFEKESSKKTYQAISNANGKFESKLPCGASYLIKIKGFNDAQDYTELEIPLLDPHQKSASFEIDIRYEPSKKFTLDNVYFEINKATITKNSYAELARLVSYIQGRTKDHFEISGHTDGTGTSEDNLVLSQKRAEAIMNYLIRKGIEAKRLKAVGYGEEYPIASNDTKAGRKLNRRTEVRKIAGNGSK